MNIAIQPMALISPPPFMIFEENYEPGEIILPRQAGSWTLYTIMPIYRKEGTTEYRPPEDCAVGCEVGNNAERPVRVTWIAGDDDAYQITMRTYQEQQAALKRQQMLAPPQLMVPK